MAQLEIYNLIGKPTPTDEKKRKSILTYKKPSKKKQKPNQLEKLKDYGDLML